MILQITFLCTFISLVLADGYAPKPYSFGYEIKSPHGEQYRSESGIGGHSVKGSYGFTDNRGIHRHVEYIADHGGFRAQVKTNEPGTESKDPAAVKMISAAHPYFGAGYAGIGTGYAPKSANGVLVMAGYGGGPGHGAGHFVGW